MANPPPLDLGLSPSPRSDPPPSVAAVAEQGDAVTLYDLVHAMPYALLLDVEAHEICWEDAAETILGCDVGEDRGAAFCYWSGRCFRGGVDLSIMEGTRRLT